MMNLFLILPFSFHYCLGSCKLYSKLYSYILKQLQYYIILPCKWVISSKTLCEHRIQEANLQLTFSFGESFRVLLINNIRRLPLWLCDLVNYFVNWSSLYLPSMPGSNVDDFFGKWLCGDCVVPSPLTV